MVDVFGKNDQIVLVSAFCILLANRLPEHNLSLKISFPYSKNAVEMLVKRLDVCVDLRCYLMHVTANISLPAGVRNRAREML